MHFHVCVVPIEPDWDLAAQPAPDFDVDQRSHQATDSAAQTLAINGVFTQETNAILGLMRLNFLSVHQFADFAFRHRVARARPDDLDDHALIQHQAFAGFGFVGNKAKISSGVALVDGHAAL